MAPGQMRVFTAFDRERKRSLRESSLGVAVMAGRYLPTHFRARPGYEEH